MSETVVHQPLQENTKEPHRSLAIEANSTDTSTNAASDMKSDLTMSPAENQLTNSTEDGEEYTAEDIKHLEEMSQKLSNDVVEKHDYQKEVEEVKATIERAFSSGLPFNVKVKMMESAMEKLKTKMNCIKENNKNFKTKIIDTRKTSSRRNAKEAKENIETNGNEEEHINSTAKECKDESNKEETSDANENKAKELQNEVINAAKIEEIKKVSDELRDENEKLEEAIAQMKQQRNILLVTIEDLRDDFDDIQFLIKEKKNALDKKVTYTEELRLKISRDSTQKIPSRASGAGTHRKTISDAGSFTVRNPLPAAIGDKITDISTTVFNTSVFQDVSSKLTQVFGSVGRALGMTREDVNPDQILTTDFMRELNNQNTPAPKSNNNNKNSSNVRPMNPQAGKAVSAPKTHTRTLSTNARTYKGGK